MASLYSRLLQIATLEDLQEFFYAMGLRESSIRHVISRFASVAEPEPADLRLAAREVIDITYPGWMEMASLRHLRGETISHPLTWARTGALGRGQMIEGDIDPSTPGALVRKTGAFSPRVLAYTALSTGTEAVYMAGGGKRLALHGPHTKIYPAGAKLGPIGRPGPLAQTEFGMTVPALVFAGASPLGLAGQSVFDLETYLRQQGRDPSEGAFWSYGRRVVKTIGTPAFSGMRLVGPQEEVPLTTSVPYRAKELETITLLGSVQRPGKVPVTYTLHEFYAPPSGQEKEGAPGKGMLSPGRLQVRPVQPDPALEQRLKERVLWTEAKDPYTLAISAFRGEMIARPPEERVAFVAKALGIERGELRERYGLLGFEPDVEGEKLSRRIIIAEHAREIMNWFREHAERNVVDVIQTLQVSKHFLETLKQQGVNILSERPIPSQKGAPQYEIEIQRQALALQISPYFYREHKPRNIWLSARDLTHLRSYFPEFYKQVVAEGRAPQMYYATHYLAAGMSTGRILPETIKRPIIYLDQPEAAEVISRLRAAVEGATTMAQQKVDAWFEAMPEGEKLHGGSEYQKMVRTLRAEYLSKLLRKELKGLEVPVEKRLPGGQQVDIQVQAHRAYLGIPVERGGYFYLPPAVALPYFAQAETALASSLASIITEFAERPTVRGKAPPLSLAQASRAAKIAEEVIASREIVRRMASIPFIYDAEAVKPLGSTKLRHREVYIPGLEPGYYVAWRHPISPESFHPVLSIVKNLKEEKAKKLGLDPSLPYVNVMSQQILRGDYDADIVYFKRMDLEVKKAELKEVILKQGGQEVTYKLDPYEYLRRQEMAGHANILGDLAAEVAPMRWLAEKGPEFGPPEKVAAKYSEYGILSRGIGRVYNLASQLIATVEATQPPAALGEQPLARTAAERIFDIGHGHAQRPAKPPQEIISLLQLMGISPRGGIQRLYEPEFQFAGVPRFGETIMPSGLLAEAYRRVSKLVTSGQQYLTPLEAASLLVPGGSTPKEEALLHEVAGYLEQSYKPTGQVGEYLSAIQRYFAGEPDDPFQLAMLRTPLPATILSMQVRQAAQRYGLSYEHTVYNVLRRPMEQLVGKKGIPDLIKLVEKAAPPVYGTARTASPEMRALDLMLLSQLDVGSDVLGEELVITEAQRRELNQQMALRANLLNVISGGGAFTAKDIEQLRRKTVAELYNVHATTISQYIKDPQTIQDYLISSGLTRALKEVLGPKFLQRDYLRDWGPEDYITGPGVHRAIQNLLGITEEPVFRQKAEDIIGKTTKGRVPRIALGVNIIGQMDVPPDFLSTKRIEGLPYFPGRQAILDIKPAPSREELARLMEPGMSEEQARLKWMVSQYGGQLQTYTILAGKTGPEVAWVGTMMYTKGLTEEIMRLLSLQKGEAGYRIKELLTGLAPAESGEVEALLEDWKQRGLMYITGGKPEKVFGPGWEKVFEEHVRGVLRATHEARRTGRSEFEQRLAALDKHFMETIGAHLTEEEAWKVKAAVQEHIQRKTIPQKERVAGARQLAARIAPRTGRDEAELEKLFVEASNKIPLEELSAYFKEAEEKNVLNEALKTVLLSGGTAIPPIDDLVAQMAPSVPPPAAAVSTLSSAATTSTASPTVPLGGAPPPARGGGTLGGGNQPPNVPPAGPGVATSPPDPNQNRGDPARSSAQGADLTINVTRKFIPQRIMSEQDIGRLTTLKSQMAVLAESMAPLMAGGGAMMQMPLVQPAVAALQKMARPLVRQAGSLLSMDLPPALQMHAPQIEDARSLHRFIQEFIGQSEQTGLEQQLGKLYTVSPATLKWLTSRQEEIHSTLKSAGINVKGFTYAMGQLQKLVERGEPVDLSPRTLETEFKSLASSTREAMSQIAIAAPELLKADVQKTLIQALSEIHTKGELAADTLETINTQLEALGDPQMKEAAKNIGGMAKELKGLADPQRLGQLEAATRFFKEEFPQERQRQLLTEAREFLEGEREPSAATIRTWQLALATMQRAGLFPGRGEGIVEPGLFEQLTRATAQAETTQELRNLQLGMGRRGRMALGGGTEVLDDLLREFTFGGAFFKMWQVRRLLGQPVTTAMGVGQREAATQLALYYGLGAPAETVFMTPGGQLAAFQASITNFQAGFGAAALQQRAGMLAMLGLDLTYGGGRALGQIAAPLMTGTQWGLVTGISMSAAANIIRTGVATGAISATGLTASIGKLLGIAAPWAGIGVTALLTAGLYAGQIYEAGKPVEYGRTMLRHEMGLASDWDVLWAKLGRIWHIKWRTEELYAASAPPYGVSNLYAAEAEQRARREYEEQRAAWLERYEKTERDIFAVEKMIVPGIGREDKQRLARTLVGLGYRPDQPEFEAIMRRFAPLVLSGDVGSAMETLTRIGAIYGIAPGPLFAQTFPLETIPHLPEMQQRWVLASDLAATIGSQAGLSLAERINLGRQIADQLQTQTIYQIQTQLRARYGLTNLGAPFGYAPGTPSAIALTQMFGEMYGGAFTEPQLAQLEAAMSAAYPLAMKLFPGAGEEALGRIAKFVTNIARRAAGTMETITQYEGGRPLATPLGYRTRPGEPLAMILAEETLANLGQTYLSLPEMADLLTGLVPQTGLREARALRSFLERWNRQPGLTPEIAQQAISSLTGFGRVAQAFGLPAGLAFEPILGQLLGGRRLSLNAYTGLASVAQLATGELGYSMMAGGWGIGPIMTDIMTFLTRMGETAFIPTGQPLILPSGFRWGQEEQMRREWSMLLANQAYQRRQWDMEQRRARLQFEYQMGLGRWGQPGPSGWGGGLLGAAQIQRDTIAFTQALRALTEAIIAAQRALAEEGLKYQRRSLELQYRQAQERIELSERRWLTQLAYQRREMAIAQEQMQVRHAWAWEDVAWQRQQMGFEFEYSMSELQRAIRLATGREKQQLLRRRAYMEEAYARQLSRQGVEERRLEISQRWEREAFQRQRAYFEEMARLQKEEFEMQKRHLRERYELESDYMKKSHKLQREIWALEDQRRAMQYAWEDRQMQYQLEEIERQRLYYEEQEKLRLEAVEMEKSFYEGTVFPHQRRMMEIQHQLQKIEAARMKDILNFYADDGPLAKALRNLKRLLEEAWEKYQQWQQEQVPVTPGPPLTPDNQPQPQSRMQTQAPGIDGMLPAMIVAALQEAFNGLHLNLKVEEHQMDAYLETANQRIERRRQNQSRWNIPWT